MNLDKRVLAGVFQSEAFRDKVRRSHFGPDDFHQESYRDLLDLTFEVDQTDDVTRDVMEMAIRERRDWDQNTRREYMNQMDRLFDADMSGAELSLQKLNTISKKRTLFENLSETVDEVEQTDDDPESFQDKLEDHRRRIEYLLESGQNYKVKNFFDRFAERKQDRQEVDSNDGKTLNFGLHLQPFSKYFEKGWQPQEVCTIAGPTYAGKSMLMSNVLYVAMHPELNGLNVLYLFAENREVQATSRLDAIFLEEEYDNLFENPMSHQYDDFYQDLRQDGWGELFYSKVTVDAFDISDVRSLYIEAQQKWDTEIDAVFIDSPDHQQPSVNRGKFFMNKAQVYKDIKGFVDDEELIGITTTPMKPSSKNKESTVNTEDTAGSYDIARIVDRMISFDVSEEDRELNRATLVVTKNRDGDIDKEEIYLKFNDTLRMTPDAMGSATMSADEGPDKEYEIQKLDEEELDERDDVTRL